MKNYIRNNIIETDHSMSIYNIGTDKYPIYTGPQERIEFNRILKEEAERYVVDVLGLIEGNKKKKEPKKKKVVVFNYKLNSLEAHEAKLTKIIDMNFIVSPLLT